MKRFSLILFGRVLKSFTLYINWLVNKHLALSGKSLSNLAYKRSKMLKKVKLLYEWYCLTDEMHFFNKKGSQNNNFLTISGLTYKSFSF